MLVDCFLSLWFRGSLGEYSKGKATRNRALAIYKSGALRSVNSRMSKVLPKLMRLGRAGNKSDHAFEEANRQLDKITPGVELFPKSADDESSGPAPPASGLIEQSGSAGTNSAPSSTPMHDGMLLIELPMSCTKGRGPGKQKKNDVQTPLNGTSLSTYTKNELW